MAAVNDSKPAELLVVVQQIQVLDQVHFHRLYEHGNQGKQQQKKLGEFVLRTMRICVVNKGKGEEEKAAVPETPRRILGSGKAGIAREILGAFPVGRAR